MDTWDILNTVLHRPFIVDHHISSFNRFCQDDIPRIIKDRNPVKFLRDPTDKDKHFNELHVYFGGRDGTKIRYQAPSQFPNEARLNNQTYKFGIYVDLTVECITPRGTATVLEDASVFLGSLPVMLQSNLCVLGNMPREARFAMGECRNDPGGYFIVDGSEKLVMPQELRAANMVYVRAVHDDKYTFTVEIKSESEHASKMARTTLVGIVADIPSMRRGQLVVKIPNVKSPIPFFIVMRALGVISDKAIVDACLLSPAMADLLVPSVHDAGKIFTQANAIDYIRLFVKERTSESVLFILANYLLPHVGTPEDPHFHFADKALFLGHMVREVFMVSTGQSLPTDRDSFKCKRVLLSGTLLADLFKEYYNKQQKHVIGLLAKEYTVKIKDGGDRTQLFCDLLTKQTYGSFFQDRPIETGFLRAFKGSWGSETYTKKIGVVQQMNRISFLSAISGLRKCSIAMDASAKVRAPRLLHPSQWGLMDPVDTPDGGHIGLQKHFALLTRITVGSSKSEILQILNSRSEIVAPRHLDKADLMRYCKIFVNGAWHGSTPAPAQLVEFVRSQRRRGVLSVYVSISWIIRDSTIHIYTDAGRPQRPVFFVDGSVSCDGVKTWTWGDPGVIEYLDTSEAETAFIALERADLTTRHTHLEIHGSLLLGAMGNLIVFPEHNPSARNLFSCSQSKQAISLYHTNWMNRMDKMAVVLNNGQSPLIKSVYHDHLTRNEHPYGVNVMVAIMSYTGYNTEDALIFNQASLDRGMFHVTYYNSYEHQESTNSSITRDTPEHPGKDYSLLNEFGVVEEGAAIRDKTVLINASDTAVLPKRGQTGFVDKVFLRDGVVGTRLAKIRIRDDRRVELGDKFASRAGQKGTCGIILAESDMPFTDAGLRPDVIINPHAIPTRMTIGQLVESLLGKAHLQIGTFGDATAFDTASDKVALYTEKVMQSCGLHPSGTEVFTNGFTGELIESNVFVGPTYYMRLKHMVKDKINYRPRGPMTALTRQPVEGRANDGGLRIGEMERDGILGNGMTRFLQDAYMNRSDASHLLVDSATGLPAIRHRDLGITLSALDGPAAFDAAMELDTGSRYSTSFHDIQIPHAFKLLSQELTTMNVQMRIVTRDAHLDELSLQPQRHLFSTLPLSTFAVIENTLYVSSSSTGCFDEAKVYPETLALGSTIFPCVSTNLDFERFVAASTIIESTTEAYNPTYEIPQLALDVYARMTRASIHVTLKYFYEKMKTGIFVRIKNNRVANFTWMYNTQFKNDFSKLLVIPDIREFVKEASKTFKQEVGRHTEDTSKWHATNCLLRTEKVDRTPTDQYLAEIYDMLASTCAHRRVGDCMFMLNRKDFPHLHAEGKEAFTDVYGDATLAAEYRKSFLPVLSQSTSRHHADIPIPTGDDWRTITRSYFASFQAGYRKAMPGTLACQGTPEVRGPEWDSRDATFFWRGQATGCGSTSETNPRLHVQELSEQLRGKPGPILDAQIQRYTHRIKAYRKDDATHVQFVAPRKGAAFVPTEAQMRHKFALNIEGNSAAYRYGSLFGMGFCVINVRSKYKLWFEPYLTTGSVLPKDGAPTNSSAYEAITVRHDLSDLVETMQWCIDNDAACKRIAANGRAFFQRMFTRANVYDYLSDALNGVSKLMPDLTRSPQLDGLELKKLKSFVPKPALAVKTYTQRAPTELSTSVVIIPFRDAGDQDRTAQLMALLSKPQYRELNVLVVEQSADGQKFNRGALLNAGYHFLAKHVPALQTFVLHDVDIVFPAEFIRRYYGTDSKEVVHLGLAVGGDVQEYEKFLGRVLRISKSAFAAINGFPNHFYGWGGEDDALVRRLEGMTVYRPTERDVGKEMPTKNDIKKGHLSANKEMHKIENLILDSMSWRTSGLNSLQYAIKKHELLNERPNLRKITVELGPDVNERSIGEPEVIYEQQPSVTFAEVQPLVEPFHEPMQVEVESEPEEVIVEPQETVGGTVVVDAKPVEKQDTPYLLNSDTLKEESSVKIIQFKI